MVLIRHIHATGPSGAGAVTYTDTGGPTGLIPKAVRIVYTAITTEEVDANHARIGVGYYDGTNQRCVAAVAENGVAAASADCASFADNTKIVVVGNTSGSITPVLTGAAGTLGVNTVEITWDAALTSLHMDIIFFYGGNVEARVTSLASSASIGGTATTTNGPAMPNMVFAATTGNAFGDMTSGGGAGSAHGTLSEGFAGRLPSTTQSCAAIRWNDQQPTATAVANLNRDDAVCTFLSSDTAEGTRIEVSAWNSDGVEYTTRNAAASIEFCVLELFFGDAVRVWCGAPLLPVSSLGAFSRTDPGFKPLALFFDAVRSGAINTVGSTQGNLGMGFAVSNAEGSAAVFDRDNVATSGSGSRHSVLFCGTIIQNGGTALYRFSHTSFDPTGWSGNVDTAGAADLNVPYCAIEDVVEFISTETEQISETAILLKTIDRIRQTENEDISETAVLRVANILALTENEQISETAVFVLNKVSVQDETEQVSEQALLFLGNFLISTETVQISETAILLLANAGASVFTETEQIGDQALLFLGNIIQSTEAEQISESAVLVLRTAIFPLTETERISESAILILGSVLVANENVQISEEANTGAGPLRQKATKRGRVF